MAELEITRSAPELVEVRVSGGSARVSFAETTIDGRAFLALVIDDEPRLVEIEASALFLGGALADIPSIPNLALPLPPTAETVGDARPLLEELADGAYLLERGPADVDTPRAGLVTGGAFDLPGASPMGAPVVLALARTSLRVGGTHAAVGARHALTIRALAPVALDVRALRDAIARHQSRYESVDLGPFALASLEPARDQARALVHDLRAEEGVEQAADPVRVAGAVTEYVAWVRTQQVPFEVAFVTHDGRRIDEVAVRTYGKLRASGLRPSARAIAVVLRDLAREP